MSRLAAIKKTAYSALDSGSITDETVSIIWLVRELERAHAVLNSKEPDGQWGYGHPHYERNHSEVVTVPGRSWEYTPATCDHLRRDTEEISNYLVCDGCGLIVVDPRIQILLRCVKCDRILDIPNCPDSADCGNRCRKCAEYNAL